MLVYKEKLHSYKEFPLRIAEIGLVHRHELSGVLNGLFRVRPFYQDDAHIYMTEKQIKKVIVELIEFYHMFYKTFNLDYELELSTKPEKSIGTKKQWDIATKGLEDGLKASKKKYQVLEGEGAFYGPKIDFHVKDSLGRKWQCGTIQLDMFLPERFDLKYEGSDGKKHRPIMVHRALYGSIERFFGILIEHYAGNFPLWLAPVQVKVITVNDSLLKYGEEITSTLKQHGIRAELDTRTESIGKKVRDAAKEKIPYIINIGPKEVKSKKLAVRTRDGKVKFGVPIKTFLKQLQKEIETKK